MSIRATLMADRSTVGRKSGSAPKVGHTRRMADYRRNRVSGGTFFFTVNLLERRSNLLVEHIDALRAVVRRVRARAPFHIDAWVVLPDHMHCLWTLPQGDADFPGRWRAIKIAFSIVARCRTAIRGDGSPRRARHLAAPLLGAYDPR
jgi:REP element-mobilizing transposase RayT